MINIKVKKTAKPMAPEGAVCLAVFFLKTNSYGMLSLLKVGSSL
jgi:hypothetical protein